jgi:hypothetical protein
VSNVNVTVIHNTYNKTVVVNNTTVNRTSFNGGTGGVTAQPTPAEQAAANEHHVGATSAQMQQEHVASTNKAQFASVNHGNPGVAGTAKPGAFTGSGVVGAKGAASSTNNVSNTNVPNKNGGNGNTRNDRPPTDGAVSAGTTTGGKMNGGASGGANKGAGSTGASSGTSGSSADKGTSTGSGTKPNGTSTSNGKAPASSGTANGGKGSGKPKQKIRSRQRKTTGKMAKMIRVGTVRARGLEKTQAP